MTELEAAQEAVMEARERVLRAALRVLSAEREEEHGSSDAEREYADDLLITASRELADAVATAKQAVST